MPTTPYPHLLSPLTVGNTVLPNRIIMGSMHLGLEERIAEPGGAERLAAFYRERADSALIVTGGYSPNAEGNLTEHAATLGTDREVAAHRIVTDAVHEAGGRIALQLLHAGRYAAHAQAVAPSPLRAPISRVTPRELTDAEIEATIDAFARTAALARTAGYDGVEIMGSEGYLINQFIAPRTNRRTDRWGGSFENRTRFAVEIVRHVREALGPDPIVMFRLSMLDLVPGGSTPDEVVELASRVEAAGASIISTGIGWHEARRPTIAGSVPRGAFSWVSRRVREAVSVPVVTANRFNSPETAERVLERGDADLVSLARPFLADPEFVAKAAAGTPERINTCIGCNQACLDHIFEGREASCLVNPRAGRETELVLGKTARRKRIAVVGAGPSGLACATAAAARGHEVVLYDAADRIGGQLNVALQVPGKGEFSATLRYFSTRIAETGVVLRLGRQVDADELAAEGFDEIVIATGVRPRVPEIRGIDHPSVLSYLDVLRDRRPAGDRVAILGAGGIGFDVATYLTHEQGNGDPEHNDARTAERDETSDADPAAIARFLAHWDIDRGSAEPGGVVDDLPRLPAGEATARQVTLLQRSPGKPGARLGTSTGWIHRLDLARQGVRMQGGVEYVCIDDAGLTVRTTDDDGQPSETTLAVDAIVVCTGQEPERGLHDALAVRGIDAHLIGGAHTAGELDAKRAIEQGTRLAAIL